MTQLQNDSVDLDLVNHSSTKPGSSGPRIAFVSSTTAGGSGRSQRELNAALNAAGLDTMMLVDDGTGHQFTRLIHEQLWDASVRFKETPILGTSAQWLRRLPGRSNKAVDSQYGDLHVSHAPENAFPDLALSFQPDVVVASSISRPTWRAIRETCVALGVRTVLYLREQTALGHLKPENGSHDLVLANSRTLVDGAARLGVEAHFVPSVVDLSSARCRTSRDSVLLVNPMESHGVNKVADLATHFPMTSFVLQESWDLSAQEHAFIDSLLSQHRNISFRERTTSPAVMFRDVGLLLAPHQIDNRPRTVLEAQVNGIPVIATAQPGLVEAVGPGGICVPIDGDATAWCDAMSSIWCDPTRYGRLEREARRHAERDEVNPVHVTDDFIRLVEGVSEVIHL